LYHGYYNFCLPHRSLRQPLPQPVPTNGTGSAKHWRPCTPAMAAGLTAHVWTLKEVLLFRVPPWPQPQTVNWLRVFRRAGASRIGQSRREQRHTRVGWSEKCRGLRGTA
jgi:hypothetical protein